MKKRIALLLTIVLCISCLAACKNADETGGNSTVTSGNTDTTEDAAANLTAAKKYLFAMYKDKQGTTASDYERVAVLTINGTKYDVVWTTNAPDAVSVIAGDKFATIDVNEKSPVDVAYVLTGTITAADGATETVEFTHNIPAYKEASWADYAAAESGTTVICTGVVSGLIAKSLGNSSNCIYFQDADGGYYVYNLSSDPVADLGLAVGMTIRVTGSKDVYSGTYEIVNASVEIVDSSVKELTPVDFTDLFTAADSLKDSKLVEKQALLVTLKGVEIGAQDLSSGYCYFKLGGKQSYIRISSSVCPIVSQKDAFLTAHAEHAGWLANVTGVLCLYDGAFYLTPVTADAFEYLGLPEKTDAEKAAFEAENLSLASKYTDATSVELPAAGATYAEVAISWASDQEEVIAVADGMMNVILPKEDTVVTMTATLTCGKETVTKEITVKVEAPATDMSVSEILEKAFALAEGESITGKQVLRGTIVEIATEYSEKYDNITVNLQVGESVIQCFRLAGGADLAVGDEITVTGIIKNYKGTVEFDAKCTYSKTLSVEEAKQLVVMEKAFALAEGETMTGKQVVRGTIQEITTEYSEKYDNITVTLQVGDYVITCFRLAGGADLAVGDEITVTGIIKNYKGTVEFDAKCTYSKEQTIEEAKQLVVMEKAFALAEGETMTGKQVVRGTIQEITTEYSEKYDNITVTLQVGDYVITCFRLAGGNDLAVGDTITVTGIIKNYKGTVEFDAKCTYEK